MEKIFNNQGELSKWLNTKTGKNFIMVPDFDKDADGNYVMKDELLKINTLAGFKDYIAKHQEIVEFLGENYPKLVSTIYKNTMTSFTDPKGRTTYAKIFSGKPVKNTEIYQEAHATDIRSIFSGFLKTYNAKNMGLEGNDVLLPKVKRTKKQFMKLFEKNNKGYMIPEIDKNGLVVNATNSKDDFSVNFIAVPAEDVTNYQLSDYFTAPFGDKIVEAIIDCGVDFDKIEELCLKAYENIGQAEMVESLEEIMDYCMAVYPLSFSRFKADPIKTKMTPVVESESGEESGEWEPVVKDPSDDEIGDWEPIVKDPSEDEIGDWEPIVKDSSVEPDVDPVVEPIVEPDVDPVVEPVDLEEEPPVRVFETIIDINWEKRASRIKDINGTPIRHSRINSMKCTKRVVEILPEK